METASLIRGMPPQTLMVFEALASGKYLKKVLQQFVLVGGTALSIYINHRLSEDLDFFKNGYDLNKREIYRFLEKNNISYKIIAAPSREYEIARKALSIGTFKLFCQQLLYTKDIEEETIKEHLSPRYNISLNEIKGHFEAEVRKELEKIAKI